MNDEGKTILYVGGFELPDKNAAAQRCVANAKIFRDLGYKVVLLGVSKTQQKAIEREEYFGFDCWSIPYPKSTRAWLKHITSLDQVNYLFEKEYSNQVAAVVCYNHPAISQYRIKRLAHQHKALALADVTEWYSVSGSKLAQKIVKWLDTSLRMYLLNFMMDGLITTSDYLSRFYQKKTIVELPTLYDKSQLHDFIPVNSSSRNAIPELIYAGSPFDVAQAERDRSAVKERLDLIIESLFGASSQGINFHLSIFGVTREDYLRVYPEHSETLDELKQKIKFKGRCTHSVILDNIAKSDFSIFLRDINRVTLAGFPSKFAESVTLGTPVITNPISNLTSYAVEGKNCFYVDIDDKDARIKSLILILSSTHEDISDAKEYCRITDTFDYRAFKQCVGNFLNQLFQK